MAFNYYKKETPTIKFNNVYNDDKAISINRMQQSEFYETAGEKIVYLAVDYDLGKDITFGEDNFSSIVALYDTTCRTEDGKPLVAPKTINPFGFMLDNSRVIYINIDSFNQTSIQYNNNHVPSLVGKNWIPRSGDLIYSVIYDYYFQVNFSDTDDTNHFLGDRTIYKIPIIPYTKRNINTSAIDFEDNESKLNRSMEILNSVLGVDTVDKNDEPIIIDTISNVSDISKDLKNDDITTIHTEDINPLGDW